MPFIRYVSQEVYIALGGAFTGDTARNALFLYPGNTNHWLKLKLVGTKANRAAIGARIKVTVKTPTGSHELNRSVSSGASFGSNPLRAETGFGVASEILTLLQHPEERTNWQFLSISFCVPLCSTNISAWSVDLTVINGLRKNCWKPWKSRGDRNDTAYQRQIPDGLPRCSLHPYYLCVLVVFPATAKFDHVERSIRPYFQIGGSFERKIRGKSIHFHPLT